MHPLVDIGCAYGRNVAAAAAEVAAKVAAQAVVAQGGTSEQAAVAAASAAATVTPDKEVQAQAAGKAAETTAAAGFPPRPAHSSNPQHTIPNTYQWRQCSVTVRVGEGEDQQASLERSGPCSRVP